MHSQRFKKQFIIAFIVFIITGAVEMVYAAPLRLLPNNLPNGLQYEVYSQTLTASRGTPPYFWSQTGTLPTGLTFTPSVSTADISGIPTQTGTFAFTVTLTDSAGGSVPNSYSITITPGRCTFVGSNTGAISFGAIDPSTPGPILGTVTQQIQFTCQAGKAYTVAVNPASGWAINSGVNAIPYTLGFIAGGTGLGATPINLLSMNSQILQADYLNAAAGAYANSQPVNLTISWNAPGAGSITATLPINSVSGTVISTCAVSQTPGTLTFAIDPSVAGMTSATITPNMLIKCTSGDSVVITASSKCGGAAPQLDSAYPACGGTQIPYTFTFVSSAIGLGFGTAIPLNIGGSANSANYQNAPVGNYGDLQTLTITY